MKRNRQDGKVCPMCGERYDFRIPSRKDDGISLGGYYRHRADGEVFFHEIPTHQAVTVPYGIQPPKQPQ